MPYSLSRTRDGAGDSGPMSTLYFPVYDENDPEKIVDVTTEHNSPPKVGAVIRVGSPYSRSYSAQDWWQTTLITEILEERTDSEDPDCLYIRFKTGNSEYEWRSF